MTTTTATKFHKFEKAGLGAAPYRYLGFTVETYQACHGAPIQVGTSCDYCGTGIKDTFHFRSADGKSFKVGSTCVGKAGDKGMVDIVKREVNRLKRERKHKRDAARIAKCRETYARDDVVASLFAVPHPLKWRAKQGDTLRDWAEWMLKHSGTAGRIKVCRVVERTAKPLEGSTS